MDRYHKDRNQSGQRKIVLAVMVMLFSLTFVLIQTFKSGGSAETASSARSGMVVIEQKSGRVLKENNKDVKLPMASTTKVLTAITAIDNANLEDTVTIDKRAVGIEGSSIYLTEGEQLKLKDLLYGLMLRSGNDAATAIGLHVGGGDLDRFIEMMNEKAKELGAENSHFTNPHGLHDENHYTTAHDLAKITAYAYNNADFCEIVATKSIRVTNVNDPEKVRVFVNKNKMLSEYEGGNGVKTGFTKAAGRCLVSGAMRDDMQLICVVLNYPDMWGASKYSMNECFNEYQMVQIAESEKPLKTVEIDGKHVDVKLKKDLWIPVKKTEKLDLYFEFDVKSDIESPKKNDEMIGKINVYNDNQLIFSENMFSMNVGQ